MRSQGHKGSGMCTPYTYSQGSGYVYNPCGLSFQRFFLIILFSSKHLCSEKKKKTILNSLSDPMMTSPRKHVDENLQASLSGTLNP